MGIFSRFEGRLEDTFEGAANKMFDSPISPVQIAKKAEKKMRREKMVGAGKQYAPTLYSILVNVEDDERLFGYYPTLAGETETYLAAKAVEEGLVMDGNPLVRFIVDESLKKGKFDVIAEMVASPIIEQLRAEEMERYGIAPARRKRSDAPQQQDPRHNSARQRQEAEREARLRQEEQDRLEAQERQERQVLPYVPKDEIDYSIDYGEYTFNSQDFDDYEQNGVTSIPRHQPNFDGFADPDDNEDEIFRHTSEPLRNTSGDFDDSRDSGAFYDEADDDSQFSYSEELYAPADERDDYRDAYGPRERRRADYPEAFDNRADRREPYFDTFEGREEERGRYPESLDNREALRDEYGDDYESRERRRADYPEAFDNRESSIGVPAQAQAPALENVPNTVVFAAGSGNAQPTPDNTKVIAKLMDVTDRRSYDLATKRILIGRDSKNDIVVDDINVSREHAELRFEPQGVWFVADLGSTNGTLVNGKEITSQALYDGDYITIGMSNFVFMQS